MDLGSNVERVLLGSGVMGRCLLGMALGSVWVIPLLKSTTTTYDILRCDSAHQIEDEHNCSDHTSLTWVFSAGKPCSSTWRAALKRLVEIVEIDENKIGRLKYNRGHPVQGQCVSGGVERGSGLVPVPDKTDSSYTWMDRTTHESSAIAGVRITISTRKVTSTTPLNILVLQRSTHGRPHQHNRGHVASRQGLSGALHQGGELPLPPGALYVRSELQGDGNTTFPRIHAFCREETLVACPDHFRRRLCQVIPFTSFASPQTGMVTRNTDHHSVPGLTYFLPSSLIVLLLSPSSSPYSPHVPIPPILYATITVICYRGISVIFTPHVVTEIPVADGSFAGGHAEHG